jgi:flagellar motor switch protein FliG
MPTKQTPKAVLRKHLGQKGADALLSKINKMAATGASAAKIEKAVSKDIAAHIQEQVSSILAVKIGPLKPISAKPLLVSIKPAVKSTQPIRINSGVSIKVGPPSYTKGSK